MRIIDKELDIERKRQRQQFPGRKKKRGVLETTYPCSSP